MLHHGFLQPWTILNFGCRVELAALSGICFTRACLYQPLSPTVLYKMHACAFWCPYPGGNNGKSLLRKAAFRRLFSKALRPPPATPCPAPLPPIPMLGRSFLSLGFSRVMPGRLIPQHWNGGWGGGECRTNNRLI